ncbi:hypothetical protein F2P81_008411 [Scophthalmus maximus]|uniref:Uncharacterized protein n=1 Tax=Scophthalmus maximus TaxID=52904 RepID=A0A6A4SY65_SCOMX|nr:hypothetical protein F2P81_008411 [Scophthalmus maximus]
MRRRGGPRIHLKHLRNQDVRSRASTDSTLRCWRPRPPANYKMKSFGEAITSGALAVFRPGVNTPERLVASSALLRNVDVTISHGGEYDVKRTRVSLKKEMPQSMDAFLLKPRDECQIRAGKGQSGDPQTPKRPGRLADGGNQGEAEEGRRVDTCSEHFLGLEFRRMIRSAARHRNLFESL